MKGVIMKVSDKLLLLLLKRAIIETINDELKNIAQMEYSKLRSFDNFTVNTLGALAAYSLFPKIPIITVERAMIYNWLCSKFVDHTLMYRKN